MAAKFTRVAVVGLALATLILAACDKGMKIGSWQIIKPKPPLVANRVEFERWHMAAGTDQAKPAPTPATSPATRPAAAQPGRADAQRIAIDLNSGRAGFTDVDGRTFPMQLEPDVVQKVRDWLATRKWQETLEPAEDAPRPLFYCLTAFDGSAPLKERGYWAEPSSDPLPADYGTVDDLFAQAERIAHPLSDKVNLLK